MTSSGIEPATFRLVATLKKSAGTRVELPGYPFCPRGCLGDVPVTVPTELPEHSAEPSGEPATQSVHVGNRTTRPWSTVTAVAAVKRNAFRSVLAPGQLSKHSDRLRGGGPGNRGSIPCRFKRLFSTASWYRFWGQPRFLRAGNGGSGQVKARGASTFMRCYM
jgi:hypothetical protein